MSIRNRKEIALSLPMICLFGVGIYKPEHVHVKNEDNSFRRVLIIRSIDWDAFVVVVVAAAAGEVVGPVGFVICWTRAWGTAVSNGLVRGLVG